MARNFYEEKSPVSENADLESKTIEALRHYREALATVENLEREEASAHRALTSMLPDLGCALLEERSAISQAICLKLAR